MSTRNYNKIIVVYGALLLLIYKRHYLNFLMGISNYSYLLFNDDDSNSDNFKII